MQKPSVGALATGACGVLWLGGLAVWVLAVGAFAAGGFGAGLCGPVPASAAREGVVPTSPAETPVCSAPPAGVISVLGQVRIKRNMPA